MVNQFQPLPARSNAAWLAGRIKMLFEAYRKDDFHDPEGFVLTLEANLERFPPEVVEYVTDRVTGIQTRNQWPPSVAEIIEACRAEMEHRVKVAKYSSLPPAERLPKPTYSVAESYEAMTAKHGRPFGPFEPGRMLTYRG